MNPVAQAFGIGIILGIILFFILARVGLIDKLLVSIDKWFK
jgi:predicted RND superfamily exporter protein